MSDEHAMSDVFDWWPPHQAAKICDRLLAHPGARLEVHYNKGGHPFLRVVPPAGAAITWDTADDLLNETFRCPPVCS